MKYYIELTLLPDAEINIHHLWSKIFPQVHLALVEQKTVDNQGVIGLSWPKYQFGQHKKTVGNKLRFFAESNESLAQLNLEDFLDRFKDYVHIRSIEKVPESIKGYGCFYRINQDESNEKLSRRYSKKAGIPLDAALEKFANRKVVTRKEPFIQISSLKGKQAFKLFLAFEEKTSNQPGYFNPSYGVTPKAVQATVPIF